MPETTNNAQAKTLLPFRRSDIVYLVLSLVSVWFGCGEIFYHVLVVPLALMIVLPVLCVVTRSIRRGSSIFLIMLLISFFGGRLYKMAVVHYAMGIPAKVIPLLEAYKREHGVYPARPADIKGMPWIPPLLQYEIWEEGRSSFKILSRVDYWHNWSYDEKTKEWVHFSG